MALLLCLWLVLLCMAPAALAQEETTCYGPGSIATSVILSVIFTAALVALLVYLWKRYKKRRAEHLILETDPEKGKNEYAFDNPGFKDAGLTPVTKSLEKNAKLETASGHKPKWNQWSPLAALSAKSEKRKTLDDSAIDGNEIKVVALRSHDFTGLGFNICGNMKEGIFIKDVLHRGPAYESGKLNPGDRINSVTISFEHMVYEDALSILSYASPYDVIIEAKGGKIMHHQSPGQGAEPSHPVYRSSSCADLFQNESARKKLFGDDHTGSLSSNYSSLQKSRSNMTTLERKESKSPRINQQVRMKKTPPTKSPMNSDQLKTQLEQKILVEHQNNLRAAKLNEKPPQGGGKIETQATQKSENKFQKFGVKVLPEQLKNSELSQNDNNINIEKQPPSSGIDEVDEPKPQAKKRERKSEILPTSEKTDDNFKRDLPTYGSGIKRDANGIPQEIPSYMMNAAVAARTNRKSSEDRLNSSNNTNKEEEEKTPKKMKGKAPAPPDDKTKFMAISPKNNFDEIRLVSDDVEVVTIINKTDTNDTKESVLGKDKDDESSVELRQKDYGSDSDMDGDNQSSVNTIELNSSDITIHHAEENEEREGRKTASTGDLTKIQKTRKTSGGTLERAQSLDITDTGIPNLTKKRKGGRIEDTFDLNSDEDLFGKAMINKEPRLSLILDGLNTFQRNRLKKSTEWGNLEDAILKLNQEEPETSPHIHENTSMELIGDKSKEFDALVNKINEIKRESLEVTVTDEPPLVPKKIKNQIWPSFGDNEEKTPVVTLREVSSKIKESVPLQSSADRRQRKPALYEEYKEELVYKEVLISSDTNEMMLEDDEKKDFLIESRLISKQIYPPSVTESEEASSEMDEVVLNKSDEIKTSSYTPPSPVSVPILDPDQTPRSSSPQQIDVVYVNVNVIDLTKAFIITERIACSEDDDDYYRYLPETDDTNISDDIKVSRHSLGSLERPKSDDAKTVDLKMNVSNVTVNNLREVGGLNDKKDEDLSELYTTALDNTIANNKLERDMSSTVTISTPDIIKNVTITEAINTLNNDVIIQQGPSSLTLEIPSAEEAENRFSSSSSSSTNKLNKDTTKIIEDSDDSLTKSNSSLTYITEIQVLTPNSSVTNATNISEIEIIPNINSNGRNFDNEFENYVKNFESNVRNFETTQKFDSLDSPQISERHDAEKERHKIHEIAEEQLKKLPEMRFTTSSYESPKTPTKTGSSQIELLKSNFEKSPPKSLKGETKSRIPIATTAKTPPTSPERRDSRNLDNENDKAILELMSSSVHSTPLVTHSKYQIKPSSKNVTVTSIRSNSKIPSGLPVLGGGRPPVPPRKYEGGSEENIVQVSTNGGVESSFKQWVFNPAERSVTNIVVTENKQVHK